MGGTRRFAHLNDPELSVPRIFASRGDWANPPTDAILVEASTGKTLRNRGTPSAPVWKSIGYTPAWADQGADAFFAAWGDGRPQDLEQLMSFAGTTVTPTNLGATVGRIWRFQLPQNLLVSALNVQTVAISGFEGTYMRFSIYRASDGVQVLESTSLGASPNSWREFPISPAVQLEEGVPYWMMWNAPSGSSGGVLRFMDLNMLVQQYGASSSPGAAKAIGIPEVAQVSLTSAQAGDHPAQLPAIQQVGSADGVAAFCFLRGTAS